MGSKSKSRLLMFAVVAYAATYAMAGPIPLSEAVRRAVARAWGVLPKMSAPDGLNPRR